MIDESGHSIFDELLATGEVLVADGAMGSLLFDRGLEAGGCPELLNVDRPDIVAAIHREYVDAGADIILTNTFGGTRARLSHYRLDDRVTELNAAGVALARAIGAEERRPVAIAGSMGPTGELFAPYGPLDNGRALELFTEQAIALKGAGVDLLWIETMSSIDELSAAHMAASETDLPIAAMMSFDSHGRTMMGVSANDLGSWAVNQSRLPRAIGANCGIGPVDVVEAVHAMSGEAPGITLIAKANCGLPVMVGGELQYPERPNDMARYTAEAIRSGARIIGVCCGSTPDHVARIKREVSVNRTG
ncbi:MAG: betaine--homocysteine S-methyltransferase [Actinomycetia bacterium]|nr:betaine--homocysteine S-methyltransferase [Actinomycetes bacterium]